MPKKTSGGVASLVLLCLLLQGTAPVGLPPNDLTLTPVGRRWASRTLAHLTLEEKIGQMIAVRANGVFHAADGEAMKDLEFLVRDLGVGGAVFFAGQVFETAWLTNHLQRQARIPLLVSSDYERGAANRVEGATDFPPLMALGASDSEELAYQMGRITAVEGRAMGVHQALAPVADVNVNPLNPIINTRSVGEDPEQVARLARAFVLGCQRNGMACTAKHFPGHGDTETDTHLNLAVLTGDRSRLDQVELWPFRRLIDAGVMSVMTGHLSVPALDPEPGRPATLSPALLTELLRGRMRFKGLIVTDAMDMGGITTLLPAGEAAVRAAEAGADMLLLPADPREAVRALLESVRSGRIPEYRINASVKRILDLKARLGLYKEKTVDLERLSSVIGSRDHLFWANRAFESSLTLVKNEGPVLPLAGESGTLAVLSLSSDESDYFAGRVFVQEILKRRRDAGFDFADAHTDPEKVRQSVERAVRADAILVALFSRLQDRKGTVGLNPLHVQAVRDAAASGKRLAVVSFGSPYFLVEFPEAACYVCAYRSSAEAQRAAVRALFGETGFTGRLPVSLPGLFSRGHGLSLPAARTGEAR
ncbi:MAG: glycoside hydrolase family 3 protein [Candidatus Aminicenantes bacterium]|nr:glycoside hydrolase family 3 protein [Candidatus Aminicenantes bacterium]